MTLTLPRTADTTVAEGWSIPHPEGHLSRPPASLLPDWNIPQPGPTKLPALMARLRELKSWTGWSSRTLGKAVGTNHVTVEAILRGDSQLARSPQVAQRVATLYELAFRLYKVVEEDVGELDRSLTQRPTPNRPSALMLLASGHPSDAYLAALDVITPLRTSGMMRGRYPAQPGQATVALDDD